LIVTLDNFQDVTGVDAPWKYTVAKTLSGDDSDSITGMVGVGPKTAAKIVAKCDIMSAEGEIDKLSYNVPCECEDNKWIMKMDSYIQSGLYERTFKIVDLALDRTGARYEILHAKWQACNMQQFNAWLTRWGFSSLITMGAASTFMVLREPVLMHCVMNVPMIWDYEHYPQV
jgi:hypothetical protein